MVWYAMWHEDWVGVGCKKIGIEIPLITRTNLYNQWRERVGYLLQLEGWKEWPAIQVPFHRDGIGSIPLSLKLSDSGQIPAILTLKMKQK